jgi:hypothetical protein
VNLSSTPDVIAGVTNAQMTTALGEWFRINLRHGWIGNHARANRNDPFALADDGRHAIFMRSREQYGTDLPYGPKAIQLGLAWETPPETYVPWEKRKNLLENKRRAEKAPKQRRERETVMIGRERFIVTPRGLVDKHGELRYETGADPPAGEPPDDA